MAGAVLRSCLQELTALKPGNVGEHGAGHNMVLEQFRVSAHVVANPLGGADGSVGERILSSIRATHAAVGCNTNLGIVLLAAPLAHCMYEMDGGDDLQERLRRTLARLSVADAQDAFDAISLAQPAGLGKTKQHDVAERARVTLLAAMASAAKRDRIAYEYISDYSGIFGPGLEALGFWREQRAVPFDWATVGVYLSFLAEIPDSHIVRKFGRDKATEVMSQGGRLRDQMLACAQVQQMQDSLMQFDRALKRDGLNPGTSADLTVATLLAFHLQELLTDTPVA